MKRNNLVFIIAALFAAHCFHHEAAAQMQQVKDGRVEEKVILRLKAVANQPKLSYTKKPKFEIIKFYIVDGLEGLVKEVSDAYKQYTAMVTVKSSALPEKSSSGQTGLSGFRVSVALCFVDENKNLIDIPYIGSAYGWPRTWIFSNTVEWVKTPGDFVVKVPFIPPHKKPSYDYEAYHSKLKGKSWRFGVVVYANGGYPYKYENEAIYIDFLPEQYVQEK